MKAELGQLPATRWDRLVAVLEENEPERAIDAPHILERAKKLNFSDLELFYLLLLRYQDKQPKILMEVVSLYAMMSTWMRWIVQVQRCMEAKKGKVDTGGFPHTAPRGSASLHTTSQQPDTSHTLQSRTSGSCASSLASSNLANCSPDYGSGCTSLSNSGLRSACNRLPSVGRGFRGKAVRGGHSTSHHRCFDLGPGWKWDGSLDFLRNGYVLSCLVEEALDHSGKFETLQDDYRAHPETLNPSTYAILYPSLADIDSANGSSDRGGAIGDAKTSSTPSALNYFPTLDTSELSCSLRGKAPVSKTLRMIEQQGKSLAAAEQWVRKLNGMCEHFLGWEASAHNNCAFFDLSNPDNLLRPLNSDDVRLIYRMHWLAVALYRVIQDPSIIPAPPRMSFIVSCDGQSELPNSLEDDEIGLLVATKCSCLPVKTRLSVTMKDLSNIQLFHPDMKHGPRILPCTVVKNEVFAYFKSYHAFIPVWSVLQYYIKRYDGMTWRFEMNREERAQELQMLATNLSTARTDFDTNNGLGAVGSCATFDLTMRSCTARQNRQCRSLEVQGSALLVHTANAPNSRDSSPDRRTSSVLVSRYASNSLAQTGPIAEYGVATTKVRRDRATLSSPCPVSAFVSSNLSTTSTPTPGTFATPCTVSETAIGIESNDNVVSVTLEGDSAANRPRASPTHSHTTSSFTKSSASSPSSLVLVSREFTEACITGNKGATPLIKSTLVPDLCDESSGELNKGEECALGEGGACKAPKDPAVMESDRVVCSAIREAVLVTPSCVISCSPSSQVMVTREVHVHGGADAMCRDEETISDATASLMCSESHKIIRNFTASIVQESEQSGIAIFSHHFRVSSGPIGKGAFGAVYKALNLDTGRIVAVKQSRYTYDDNTADLNWREFQMWSMLPPHANVITFYGASREVDTHQLLLVMEYASGGSIVQLYHNFRPIPEPLFYDHALGIARGLKHLHDHNVIHGDVKPENVLTRSDGSVAISDFGCSCFSLVGASSDSDGVSLPSTKGMNSTWQLSGTAAYMAPEVISNEPHLKSDVWAYACTLLQLWLGQPPWSGGDTRFSTSEIIPLMFHIANEEVVPFTAEQVKRTPWWLQRIARGAFERDVEQRCTMADIISTLTECSRAYSP